MADRRSLGFIGWIYGGITALVMVTGVFVVQRHLDGRMVLDDGPRAVVSAALPTLVQ
jgi:hypothetical protein